MNMAMQSNDSTEFYDTTNGDEPDYRERYDTYHYCYDIYDWPGELIAIQSDCFQSFLQ